MQGLVPAAHPKGEDRLCFLAGVENVGMGPKRQPDKFRQRKSTLELILRFTVGDEARIEPLESCGNPDLGQRRPPGVENIARPSCAKVEIRSRVNGRVRTRAALDPKKQIAPLRFRPHLGPFPPPLPCERRRRNDPNAGLTGQPGKSGGNSVVQETRGLSNELESKSSSHSTPGNQPHITLLPNECIF